MKWKLFIEAYSISEMILICLNLKIYGPYEAVLIVNAIRGRHTVPPFAVEWRETGPASGGADGWRFG